MRPVERLAKLAEAGDRDAAEALWKEARRHDDLACAAIAACSLRDTERLCAVAAEALERGEIEAACTAAQGLGVALDPAQLKTLERVRNEANAICGSRIITPLTTFTTLAEALSSPRGFATAHGGVDPAWDPGLPTHSTVCLVVVGDDDLTVGFGISEASSPSPGRAWSQLKPWNLRYATLERKCAKWATRSDDDRIQIPLASDAPSTSPLDALVEVTPNHLQWKSLLQAIEGASEAEITRADAALDARWPEEARTLEGPWMRLAQAKRDAPHWRIARHLDFSTCSPTPAQLKRIAKTPSLRTITQVSLRSIGEGMEPLLRSPELEAVHTLSLERCYMNAALLELLLVNSQAMPALAELHLGVPPYRYLQPEALYTARGESVPDFPGYAVLKRFSRPLSHLVLPTVGYGPTHLAALLHAPGGALLRGLGFEHHHAGPLHPERTLLLPASLEVLASAELDTLEHLSLSSLPLQSVEDAGGFFLSEAPPQLRSLELETMHIDHALTEQIADWPGLSHLEHLNGDLTFRHPPGLRQLVGSKRFARLRHLSLNGCGLDAEGLRILGDNTAITTTLERLELAHGLTQDGAQALAEGSFPELRLLVLGQLWDTSSLDVLARAQSMPRLECLVADVTVPGTAEAFTQASGVAVVSVDGQSTHRSWRVL